MALSPLMRNYDQVILDLDGCVWVGGEAVPGSIEALVELRAGGLQIAFATNNARLPPEDYVARLWALGAQASSSDVVTAGGAMQHLLAETRTGATAFVIGTDALVRNVTEAGLTVVNDTDQPSRADVVVIGGTADVHYDDLRDASLAIQNGAELLACARDPTHPMPDGLWPGTGAILAAVETASGQTAIVVGKPEPQIIHTALDRLGEGRTLVVGDRLDADIAAANAAGLDGALVLSGGTTEAQSQDIEDGQPRPVAVAANLRALVMGTKD